MPEVRRRAVLVTGAARGLGRAIALDLARDGWRVGIHYNRSHEQASESVAEIERDGGRAVALHADLSHEAEVVALMERAVAALGPLTCLVNNACYWAPGDVGAVTRTDWDLHLEVNLRAPFVLTQRFARQLPSGSSGSVVNMLDPHALDPRPDALAYGISRIGLWGLTRTLALALAPRIRVNGIGIGPVVESLRTGAPNGNQPESVPLRRLTTPEEVCSALRFLLASPAVTGQVIALDGGGHLDGSEGAVGFANADRA